MRDFVLLVQLSSGVAGSQRLVNGAARSRDASSCRGDIGGTLQYFAYRWCGPALNTHQCRPKLGQNCEFGAQAVGALGSLGISDQRAAKVFDCFDIRAPVHCLLTCGAPIESSLFGPPGIVTMLGEQFRLVFGNLGKFGFEGVSDAGA